MYSDRQKKFEQFVLYGATAKPAGGYSIRPIYEGSWNECQDRAVRPGSGPRPDECFKIELSDSFWGRVRFDNLTRYLKKLAQPT